MVRKHGPATAARLRYRVDRAEDAEDLFQETLVSAWTGIGRLRVPQLFRAWLLEIARNRCRDWYRSPARREQPTEPLILEMRVDRLAVPGADLRHRSSDVLDALESIPRVQQETIRAFYLDGLTIEEIADRERRPLGTVKRHLFEGRLAIRRRLGLPLLSTGRRRSMTQTAMRNAFPEVRPAISVTALPNGPSAVDTSELRWWVVRPEIGGQALQAVYSAGGALQSSIKLKVTRPAVIHGERGVEIAVRSLWAVGPEWQPASLIYARMTPDELQYLAVRNESSDPAEPVVLQTFLDSGFGAAWGRIQRRVEDRGDWLEDSNGILQRRTGFDGLSASGCGAFLVSAGAQRFRCLRVLQLEGPVDNPASPLIEGFVDASGHVVLVRYYSHASADGVLTNPALRRDVEGVPFEHWEDLLTGYCLTGAAGVSAQE